MKLDGAHALVTGAASGLGAATASALAERGVAVLGVDLPTSLERAGQPSATIEYAIADVTDESQIAVALARIPPGASRLVVNCAGIAPARRSLSSNGPHDLTTFQRTIDINLVGMLDVLRLSAAAMSENEPNVQGQRELIVNTASVAAYEGRIGQIAYPASKRGVVSMSVTAVRNRARHGIRANTMAPGIVDTSMLAALGPKVNASLAATVPVPQRLARPEEYAQLCPHAGRTRLPQRRDDSHGRRTEDGPTMITIITWQDWTAP